MAFGRESIELKAAASRGAVSERGREKTAAAETADHGLVVVANGVGRPLRSRKSSANVVVACPAKSAVRILN